MNTDIFISFHNMEIYLHENQPSSTSHPICIDNAATGCDILLLLAFKEVKYPLLYILHTPVPHKDVLYPHPSGHLAEFDK